MENNLLPGIKLLQNSTHDGYYGEEVETRLDANSTDLQNEIEDVSSFERYIIHHKLTLEERLKKLQSTMTYLKKQLAEEKSMWKAQLEQILQNSVICEHQQCDNLEYDNNFEIPSATEIFEDTTEFCSNNFPSVEFDDVTLAKYQDPLIKLQAERRANLRRQLTINNYKRRLLEVENMCNLELLRVKQNVKFLQPLQLIASEWNLNTIKENAAADGDNSESQPSELSSIVNSETKLDDTLLVNNDINTVYTKMQYCTLKIPQAKSSPSTVWRLDDDILGLERANSGLWHTSEYFTSSVPTGINLF